MLTLIDLLDNAKCYAKIRELRWPSGVTCPHCQSKNIIKQGVAHKDSERQRYCCHSCNKRFDDLSGTIFSYRHQSVKAWIMTIYLMGLNLSNRQIAIELEINKDDMQKMTQLLRQQLSDNKEEIKLSGEVEFDEVYIIAGHKGHPQAVKAKGRKARRNRLKGARGRGTLATEKPPIFGMIQRGGDVFIRMCENVKQKTIKPLINKIVEIGSQIFTDEYSIYDRLKSWGYQHKTVNHSQHEFARDEDGDGFHEVHVNTIEGFWSLLRSWLRPHRGISQELLPIYLSFFEFTHNMRKRGKALLEELMKVYLLDPQNA